jgi:hypothetical protein
MLIDRVNPFIGNHDFGLTHSVKNTWLSSHPQALKEVGGTYYGAGNSLIEWV